VTKEVFEWLTEFAAEEVMMSRDFECTEIIERACDEDYVSRAEQRCV
jgi:hypothetical protein